jgi:hypothetical protein
LLVRAGVVLLDVDRDRTVGLFQAFRSAADAVSSTFSSHHLSEFCLSPASAAEHASFRRAILLFLEALPRSPKVIDFGVHP